MLRWVVSAIGIVVLVAAAMPPALAQLDFERDPINYSRSQPTDCVSRLAGELANGTRTLQWDDDYGYLKAVLEALEISPTSQTLVFSKTSLQVSRISPATPRALYFNDDVYVGWIPDADMMEFSAADPRLGGTFYSLRQSPESPPVIRRETARCLSCHASTHTRRVPGHIVRSVFPTPSGQPAYRLGTHITDDSSPWSERWGGWYVSGTHGRQRHMGNVVVTDEDSTVPLDVESGANITDLEARFHARRYLTSHSDLVALMVLQHQTSMHNVLTAANHSGRLTERDARVMNTLLERDASFESEATISRYEHAAEKVVRALLFCGEQTLPDPVAGTSGFAEEFSRRGPFDARGESLRDLDLTHRLFRHPCSFLIYSDSFRSLPPGVKDRVLNRLQQVLTGASDEPDYSHIDEQERRHIHRILSETLPDYPHYSSL